jgi:hypothetical protein
MNEKIILNSPTMLFNSQNKRVKILPELEFLIDPLGEDEFSRLEQSILAEGCRESIICWTEDAEDNQPDLILIDGHNRYRICTKHRLDFTVLTYDKSQLADLEAVKQWMIENQLSRRNLSEARKSYFRGQLYSERKQTWGGRP